MPVTAPVPPLTIMTDIIEERLQPGETRNRTIVINNPSAGSSRIKMVALGDIEPLLRFEGGSNGNIEVEAAGGQTLTQKLFIITRKDTPQRTYLGDIVVTSGGVMLRRIPVTIVVRAEREAGLLDVKVNVLSGFVKEGQPLRFIVGLINLGTSQRFDVNLSYTVKDENDNIVTRKADTRAIETTLSYVERVDLPKSAKPGGYVVQVDAQYNGFTASAIDTFAVQEGVPLGEFVFADWMFWLALALGAGVPGLYAYWRVRRILRARREKKARYLLASDYVDLPQGPMWLGKVAETDIKLEWDPMDLKTHCITAGATGSGKSVSASVIVEEVLKLKIPVVCFDPTAQWTGFVRPNKDPQIFKAYPKHGLKPEDARPFKGIIYEVTDPNVRIDFKKYMNPGEITVFTLNKLRPGEYDQAVMNIIDTVFQMQWEESIDLKMLVVFDEIHRLLEKYGGKGGYIALEKGAREFRKWGIGMLMVSQVSGDFREELRSNALMEVQLHTKSTTDTDRLKAKYGEEYAVRCTKLEIGVGMVAHPKYNRGKPIFVHFRPPLHEAHKIPDKDLEMYKTYATKLDQIEQTFADWKKKGIDTTDLELELKLAKDKLKEGRFRMAEVYTESLLQSMKRYEGKGRSR